MYFYFVLEIKIVILLLDKSLYSIYAYLFSIDNYCMTKKENISGDKTSQPIPIQFC